MKARFSVYSIILLICCSAIAALEANGQSVTMEGKDFLSPEIVITSPAENVVVNHDIFHLKGAVLSYKLPITEITFLLNGVVIGKQKISNQTRFEFGIPVTLKLGNNVVTVIAENSKASSKLASAEIRYVGSDTPAKPNLAVLAIGVSNYQQFAAKFAESDALEFAKKIDEQKGCVFQTINTKVLLGKEASREGILNGLNWLNKSAPTSSDVRMLYVSGKTARDEKGGYYFLSQEHRSSEDFELADLRLDLLFNKLEVVQNTAILFLDVSSGGPSYGRAAIQQHRGGFPQQGPENVIAFIGSDGNTSIENADWRHSAFTLALLEALRDKADDSGDKQVDIDELKRWIQYRVADLTKGEQQPTHLRGPNLRALTLFCHPRP